MEHNVSPMRLESETTRRWQRRSIYSMAVL